MATKSKERIEFLFDNGFFPENGFLNLSGDVDTEMADRVAYACAVRAGEPLNILLNSHGGDVADGMAIYDILKEYPGAVTITGAGQVQSMATIILQAADTRLLYKNTEIMLHDGPVSVDGHARDVIKFAEQTKRSLELAYEIYASRSNNDKAYWRRKLAHDVYLTAEEAVKEGLADKVIGGK